jgi:ribose 5-phosphate isomerase B
MTQSVVYIASDHRGFEMKGRFVAWLGASGYRTEDLGPETDARCDASNFAIKLAEALKADVSAFGVLICGTGQAMAMTANRFSHIRAALCCNGTVARFSREHNNANVLVLGANVTGIDVAQDCLEIFLKTAFLGGRYAERCKILGDLGSE